MSKRHNRNGNKRSENKPTNTTDVPTADVDVSEVETVEEMFEKSVADDQSEHQVADVADIPVEENPDSAEQCDTTPSGDSESSVRTFNVPKIKMTSEEISPRKLSAMQRNTMSNGHTAAGQKLLGLFEEYEAKMAIKTNNREELKDRALLLHRIVQAACPRKLANRQVGADLIGILFDKLVNGWGTLYKDETVFRLDYSLPGGPADIDKMNIFIEAMIQLVEAATGNAERIAFMNDRLQKVVDSEAIMIAIQNLRVGIEKRMAQQKSSVRK